MKIKVYNLKKYIEDVYSAETVSFSTMGIITCKNGTIILEDDCTGICTYDKAIEHEMIIPIMRDSNLVCLNANECERVKLSLQAIIDNCECVKKELKDFVDNPYKKRIKENMLEVGRLVRKLNEERVG